jgi:hypothetical protein
LAAPATAGTFAAEGGAGEAGVDEAGADFALLAEPAGRELSTGFGGSASSSLLCVGWSAASLGIPNAELCSVDAAWALAKNKAVVFAAAPPGYAFAEGRSAAVMLASTGVVAVA